MNTTARDIADMLDGSGKYTYGTDVFVSKEPTKPSNVITIYDTGGGIDMQLDPAYQYQRTSVQIRIRNISYTEASATAYNVIDILKSIVHETWNDTVYMFIDHVNGPTMLEYDENNRAILVLNFNIQRR